MGGREQATGLNFTMGPIVDGPLAIFTSDTPKGDVLGKMATGEINNTSMLLMTTQKYGNPLGQNMLPDLQNPVSRLVNGITSSGYVLSNDSAAIVPGGNNGTTPEDILNGTMNTIPMDSMVSLNYDLPIMILVAAVLFVVIVATAFGNLLVGLALFKFRYLRTISNYLIGNLALSDFLLATTILPMSTVQECLGHWVFGQAMCNFWLLTDVLYCTASIWNLCIIAFDRFTATLYPVWYREKRSNKQAAIYVALVWIISCAICVPPLLGWNELSQNYVYDNTTNVYNCVLFQTPSYVLYSASGSFYIPFFITFFLYVRIFMVLRRRMRKMRRSNKARNQQQNHGAAGKDKPLLNNSAASTTKPDHEIEMTCARSTNEGSGNTEELSSKSLFGSDSGDKSSDDDDDDDEEESSTHAKSDRPLYQSSGCSETENTNGKAVVKNGVRLQRGLFAPKDGTKSERAMILSPNNCSESERDSDAEKIRIVVTEDESVGTKDSEDASVAKSKHLNKDSSSSSHKKATAVIPAAKAPATTANPATKASDADKGKRTNIMNSALKSVNPFGKGQKKKVRTSTKRRYEQREMRATIRMAIIIAFFCGMWLGFFTIYVIRSWCPENKCFIPRELDAFFFWLGYSNSSINPILYTIFNEEFRRAFQKILGCYHKNRRGPHGRH